MSFPMEPRLSFSTLNPLLQLAHDSTSIKAGKKCWRYYEYNILRGFGAKKSFTFDFDEDSETNDPVEVRGGPFDTNAHILFGSLFHSATELYDQKIASGTSHADAQRYVLEVLLINTYDFVNKKPWISDEPTKCRNTLLRSFIVYTDRFEKSNLQTVTLSNGKAAVELSFRFEPGIKSRLTGEEILLCGHIDVIKSWTEEDWILDKKTTKFALDDKYFAQYTPDVQVTTYTIAGNVAFHREVKGFIIDAMQVLVNGTRFRRKEIARTPEQLEEFLREFKRYISDLETCIEEEYFPMNPEACGWGGLQCRYRDVCSSAPEARLELLNVYYTRRIWDPLEVR